MMVIVEVMKSQVFCFNFKITSIFKDILGQLSKFLISEINF